MQLASCFSVSVTLVRSAARRFLHGIPYVTDSRIIDDVERAGSFRGPHPGDFGDYDGVQSIHVAHQEEVHAIGHGRQMLVLPVRFGGRALDMHHRDHMLAGLELPNGCLRDRVVLPHRRQIIFVFGFRPLAA